MSCNDGVFWVYQMFHPVFTAYISDTKELSRLFTLEKIETSWAQLARQMYTQPTLIVLLSYPASRISALASCLLTFMELELLCDGMCLMACFWTNFCL